MIKRKNAKYDIKHGGTFQDDFVDKGVPFYTEDEGPNHSDYLENSSDFTFTKATEDDVAKLYLNGDEEITEDLYIGRDLHLSEKLFDGEDNEGDLSDILKSDGTKTFWTHGTNRQIVREKESNGVLSLEFESPKDNTNYPTPLEKSDELVTINTLANYNGTESVEGSTADNYPISHLRDGTIVHGDATVQNNLSIENKITEDLYIGEEDGLNHFFIGTTADLTKMDLVNGSFILEDL